MTTIEVAAQCVSLCAEHGRRPVFGCVMCLESLAVQQAVLNGEFELGDEDTEMLSALTVSDVARMVAKLTPEQRARVVHVRQPHDVYIGGTMKRTDGTWRKASRWANPIRLTDERERGKVLRQYTEELLANTALLAHVHSLAGKRLGCWCRKPGHDVLCHGLVLLALAEG